MNDNKLYLEIYSEISNSLNNVLGEYVHDMDKSYEAAMVLLMISMKMHMFAGIIPENLPILIKNIEKTFGKVYKDFEKVDLKDK